MALSKKIPQLTFFTTDRSPTIEATLNKSDGSGTVDLTGASAACFIRMIGTSGNQFTGSDTAAVNAGNGTVQYTLPAGGFATAGIYFAQFMVTFTGGNTQRSQRFQIKVEEGL